MDARTGQGIRRTGASDRSSRALLALTLAAGVAGCEAGTPEARPPEIARATPETTMIPVRPPPRIVARDSLPARIFYNLTRFEWYARGEPLRWDGRDWQPRGNPEALGTEALRLVGEFEGVDIWIRADQDPVTRLYVPVSEGYWLPFAAEDGPR